jgi:hypothetical protein
VLGDTASGAAQDSEGPSLVENKAELILESQFDLECSRD